MRIRRTESATWGLMLSIAQWLMQDISAGYPQAIINDQRKSIILMIDRLIERADSPVKQHRLSTLRSKVATMHDISSAQHVIATIEDMAKEWVKHDTDRRDRQINLSHEG